MTCAYAVSVAIKKFPAVESVDVSLSKGLATVKLKPGNSLRPSELWETIRKNGYTNKTARVVVRGQIMDGGSQLRVSGSSELFELQANDAAGAQAKQLAGETVTVAGTITPDKDLKRAVPLRVESITQ